MDDPGSGQSIGTPTIDDLQLGTPRLPSQPVDLSHFPAAHIGARRRRDHCGVDAACIA
jgi:hypothetical protein